MSLQLRRACISDSPLFFNLRNDFYTRKSSFQKKKIKFNDHTKWFKKNVKKKNKILLVAYFNKFSPIATVRYDLNKSSGFVSIIVEKKFRGKGYGAKILKSSEKFLKTGTLIFSEVKKNNQNSIKVFKKNNYFITSIENYVTLAKLI